MTFCLAIASSLSGLEKKKKQEKAVKDTHCYSNSVLSNFWVLAPALSPDIEDF
jgi:hypothetical protein